MKMSHFIALYCLIALCLFIPLLVSGRYRNTVELLQISYNNAVDNAVDDALEAARVESVDGKDAYINREEAVSCFYKSLSAGLGADMETGMLRIYTPVILFTVNDGYYVYYAEEYDGEIPAGEGGGEAARFRQVWSEKRRYSYEDTYNHLLVVFSMDSLVTIYDYIQGERIEGDYRDLAALYPQAAYLQNGEEFEEKRRACITGHLKEDMGYYINRHNRIAGEYGIIYAFELPELEKNDWYRTMDDPGMMVLFQGYPVSAGTGRRLNRFAVGTARIRKERLYYISEDAGTGEKTYHRGSCSLVDDQAVQNVYYSAESCAREGAWPCDRCM